MTTDVRQTDVAAAVIASCTLAVALVAPSNEVVADPPAVEMPAATSVVGVLWIRSDAVPYDALAEEIRLRLPAAVLASWRDTPPATEPGALTVFVDVRPAPQRADALVLTLIASDGRAYDRVIEVEPDVPPGSTEELVARNLVNLVFGIESGTVEPDRNDVSMPAQPATAPCPACPPVAPAPEKDEPLKARTPTPRAELGPGFSLGVLTGLGPPGGVDRFSAWAGDLSLGVRWRRGGALIVGVRSSGRAHPLGAGLVRIRVAIGGGWIWRPRAGAFELAAYLGASVEPWIVLDDEVEIVASVDERPAIGGWARLAPGYLVRTRDRALAARIGAFAELDVAYVPARDGVVLVQAQRGDEQIPLFRIGGPELALGLDVRLWFPVW